MHHLIRSQLVRSQSIGSMTQAALGWLIAVLIAVTLLSPQLTSQTFENSPIGFASVNANGQNGTTGGAGGATVTATSDSQFRSFVSQSGPLIVQVSGTIALTTDANVASNKTIIGLGSTAAITAHGLNISGVQNVIVRNIAFSNAAVNSITIQQSAHHVWVDHNSFTNATDTLMDIKRQANYVTVSWNHFTNTLETILQGHDCAFNDTGFLKVTFHHNWFDGTQTRHPRTRYANPTHVFNNYYLNITGYGVAATCNAHTLVEGNFFQNVPTPTSLTEGGDPAGFIVERNNMFVNSGTPVTSGTVTEPSTFYSYTLDPTANIPTIVTNGAGPGKINSNPNPDFSIAASPGSSTVTAGSSTTYTTTITALNGFTGTVSFSVSGLPSNTTASFNPTTVAGSGNSSLLVSTTSGTPAGTFPLTITGTSGSLSHSASVTLVVNAVTTPNFTISATPSSRTVTAGSGTTYTASVAAVNGFTGTVGFSVSGLPSGATASFSPTSVAGSGSSTLSVSTSSSTPAGTSTLTITGTSGSLVHSTTVTLVVNAAATPNFTLSATPASQTVTAGSSTSYTASVAAVNGFTGTVSFSVSGLPSGASGSFSPTSVAGSGSSTLSVSTSSTTPAGTFTLTITGTSGSLTHSATVTLVVNSAGGGQWTSALGSISPNPTHVGSQTGIVVVFTNLASSQQTANLTIQVVNSSGAVVASTTDANEAVAGGQTDSDTLDWTPAATGTYTVVGLVTNSSTGAVLSQKNLGTVTVN